MQNLMQNKTQIRWTWRWFDELPATEVYEMLAVRQQVFVVEQDCLYLDADGRDSNAWHLFGYDPHQQLIAYARLLPPNTRYPEPSIGRVLVRKAARGHGLGRQLITLCLEKCGAEYPEQNVRISAQVYLTEFYKSFGFQPTGEPYDDGGIPHVGMVLYAQSGWGESNPHH
ncbi:MAG: ElaA protein [Phormidesmis priestleyi Ana]|uniref:ElaA protein n=1 Tax=Phormidesmis priestleyi Ana TaxID=1666911 RepID=A0A0P8A347_9CYAN|nr:MAG: ElaA protein [Phormidesmis priestleyi Ana]